MKRIHLFTVAVILSAIWLVLTIHPDLPIILAGTNPFESDQLRFERLTVEEGLSQSTVLAATQDHQGYMWFGTQNGLNRYDGYEFRAFYHDPTQPGSLGNSNVFSLYEDSKQRLWVGTDGGGLNLYDPETETFRSFVLDEQDEHSISDNAVWAIEEDDRGFLWVGTRNGLNRFDPQTETFTRYMPDTDNPRSISGAIIYRIHTDSNGTVWIGTRDGLNRYDAKTDDFTVYQNDPENPESLSSNFVWDILEDSQGNLWVGTRRGGLNLMDRESETFTHFQNDPGDPNSISSDNVWDIEEDQYGNLWITTETGGLNRFDRATGKFVSFQHNPNDPFTVSTNDLFKIYEDGTGTIWITSRRNGVNKLYPSLQRFTLYRNIPDGQLSLNSNNIYAIWAGADDILWVGTDHGLNQVDHANRAVTYYLNDPEDEHSLPNNTIYSLYEDEHGVLWVGTVGGGLSRFDPETQAFLTYQNDPEDETTIISNYITAMAPAADGKLWVGTLGLGLNLFDPIDGTAAALYANDPDDPNSLGENTIYALAPAEDGGLWVGTARAGLEKLDPETGTFTHYPANALNPEMLIDPTVQALYVDADGFVWVGTANGLSRLDPKTGKFESFTTQNGLLSNNIYGVLGDEAGKIWVSTGMGISAYDPAAETFRHYDRRDGLQASQFNLFAYHQSADGEMFFGGPGGLNAFYPEKITENPNAPRVVLTDFRLFNQQVAVGDELLSVPLPQLKEMMLDYSDSVFTFEFAALNYQITPRNLYQYKMEGFDQDWSPPSTTRSATYTNLDPGQYTFQVRAANNDGIWSDEVFSLPITIIPPWWRTLWFQLLLVIGVASAISLGIGWRIRSIKRQTHLLEQNVIERTSELREEITLRQQAEAQLQQVNQKLQEQLEEIRALHGQLREQAIRDPLTNLYNRRYLGEMIDVDLRRSQRGDRPVSVLILDIDHFKEINDRYGHKAGDQVLIEISRKLEKMIRGGDIACRYGGEEFVIVLPGTTLEEARARAEQIRHEMEELVFYDQGNEIQLTVSIGVSSTDDHPINRDLLLNEADKALYEAKEQGRNLVVAHARDAS
ncbi:MAG: diguanylate cyclase [Anaerolineaceae bacterium]|nr:diguanylate cyclase [Anaerolineaceae bacterium]